jgi:putative ABC transport system permease protein
MILFRLISWPYVRKHALRSLLTITGIMIGVAVFVAMRAANAAVYDAFRQTVSKLAGKTELQVTAGALGFDEGVLDDVQNTPGVQVASPVIEAVAGTGLPGQGSLLILGVDMTGDRGLRDYDIESGEAAVIDDPLVFLAQPDSIMVTDAFAARNHLTPGATLPLDTADGPRNFIVRGILRSSGLTSAFGGNLAIVDIYAAEQVFGRGRKFDRIDLALAPGTTVADGQQAIAARLGPGFTVQTPASRGQSFESLLRIYALMLNLSSAFALVIGMFIIYHAFAIAVTERRREIGILRALGATRRQIATLFVGESAIGGFIGSAAGVAVGYALAGVTAHSIGSVLQGVYGVTPGAIDVTPGTQLVMISIAIGTITSVFAALMPARNAARVDPVVALQKGRVQEVSAREHRVRIVVSTTMAVVGGVLVSTAKKLALFYVGYLTVMIAALVLAPVLAVWLVRALRPLLHWLRPVEGALAADSLIGAPRRTTATVVALMLALTLVVGLAGIARASYSNINDWAEHALNPDFFVTGSPVLTGRDYRFPDAMAGQLGSILGIREVQRNRQGRVDYRGGQILLMATDIARLAVTSPRRALEGDAAEMYRRAAAGEGVIGSENLSSLQHLHRGDTIDLPTPSGTVQLPILGIVREYSDQQGSLMLDLSLYRKYWKDDEVDMFRVYLKPDADPEAARSAILSRFSSERRLFVLSTKDVRTYVLGVTDRWFGMTWVQILIAILVAILGIVNSLTVSIADRRRELGVLRAVGGLRSQVRGTIWMEAATIAFVSLVLGLGLGAIYLYMSLEQTSRDYPGLRFDYMYPYAVALLLLPVIVGAAWLSALGPAESAVRGSLVEALEYE